MRRAPPLLAGLLAIGLLALGGTPSRAEYPYNERPMYGGVAKTPEMVEADRRYVQSVEGLGYTRARGSDEAVLRGWKAVQSRDLATAIKRFNQAWVLDPDNGDAYHGMAIVVMERDRDAAQAEQLFRRGLAAPRRGPNLAVDYGRLLLMAGRPRDAVPVLGRAAGTAGVSPDAAALLALALADSGDWPRACPAARQAAATAQGPLKAQVASLAADAKCR